jgi:hypothetical protein
MSKQATVGVTAEDAVARILKVDYLHDGTTLREMLEAYSDDADNDCEDARIDDLTDDQKSRLNNRADICKLRCTLAERLLLGLDLEMDKENSYVIKIPKKKGIEQLFDLESVNNWAFYEFGIGLPTEIDFGKRDDPSAIPMRWEDVTIKIYADYQIGVKKPDGKFKMESFRKIGLMGARKNSPNGLGKILLRLSQTEKFPQGKDADKKSKTAISRLRISLIQLTGIQSDPFHTFNEGYGWRPRFDLIYDLRNAIERAKKEAIFVPLDDDYETPDFDRENDETQQWLDRAEHESYMQPPSK